MRDSTSIPAIDRAPHSPGHDRGCPAYDGLAVPGAATRYANSRRDAHSVAPPRFGSPQLLLDLPSSVGPDFWISPDGRWVAYQGPSQSLPDGEVEYGSLLARSLETGKVISLVSGTRVSQIVWSPDSRAVVDLAHPWSGSGSEILSKTLGAEPAVTVVEAPPGSSDFEQMAVSPDGQRVAFTVLHDASPAPVPKIGIEVMALDGGGRHQIVGPDYFIGHLAWSPDSRKVVYFKGKGGTPPEDGEAYMASADGTSAPPKLLVSGARLAAWSPNGQRALWFSEPINPDGTAELLLSGWPSLGQMRTVVKDASASGATWIDDGWIGYAENGAIYLTPAEAGENPQRLNIEGERAEAPVWLPGKGIAYRYRAAGGASYSIGLLPAVPAPATGTPASSPEVSVEYRNAQYGFSLSLPDGWNGYSTLVDTWTGNASGQSGEVPVAQGAMISIRHPQWTPETPRQDIPIMVLSLAQWNSLEEGKFHIGAAPINPRELGRNSRYVFALPARYNYAFPEGWQEVEMILQDNPLRTFEPDPALRH